MVGDNYLGRHVDDQSLLAQTRDRLQRHAMLEALESLLDTPSLVIQIGGCLAGMGLRVQVGEQHA